VQHCPVEQVVQSILYSSPYSSVRPYRFRIAAVHCRRAARVDLQRVGFVTALIFVQLCRTRTVRTDRIVQPAEEGGHDFQI
jgi:hypothetical protein